MAYASEIRDAVLQYAIQGRLTEQLDSDSSTDVLAEIIAADKQALIKRKSARNDKDFPAISDDEIPFEIPSNWKWMRVGEIGIYKKGPFGSSLTKSMFIPKSDSAVKVYEQKNAIQKDATLGNYYISKSYYEEKMQGFALEPGDIIVSCAGTIGETYVLPASMEMGIMNQALMRMNISEHINLEYFLIYFDHVLKINAQSSSQGTAIKNIPAFEIFKKMLFPVPPIEEQQRIVDRVNVLMSKLDEFSEIEQQLIALKANFPADMRGAILQAAMQGKLTEQLDTDTPVDTLLFEMEKEKEQYGGKRKARHRISLSDISEDEIPCEIPSTWRYVRLIDIVKSISAGGDKPKNFTKEKTEKNTIKVISNGETNKGIFGYTDKAVIEETSLTISGRGTIGYSVIRTEPYVPIVRLLVVLPLSKTNLEYIKVVLTALIEFGSGTAVKQLTVPMISPKVIPLPPIEEQQRIVERLDALLPLCDTLV